MSPLHFSLLFSGTVIPNNGDDVGNAIAITRSELHANLDQAVANITGNGLVTGNTSATLDEHSHQVRISNDKADMMAMPVISTAHLDAVTALQLSDADNECPWAVVAPYDDGMFIRFFKECDPDTEIPECARAIHGWLIAQGLNGWVRLDRDWECVESLPVYDW